MHPGHEAWITHDYGGKERKLRLSKASLGNFLYHCLRLGGHVTSGNAFAPDVDGCYVQLGITLPKGKREDLERLSGIKLDPPTQLTPAMNFGSAWPDPLETDSAR